MPLLDLCIFAPETKNKRYGTSKNKLWHVAGTDRLSDSGNIRDKKHSDKQNRKREEIPKWLNKEQALKYIQKQGYKLSSSKLYKLSATDNIPCHRSGRNLYFFAEELDKWLNNQIEEEGKTSQNLSTQSIQLIIKSAQQR